MRQWLANGSSPADDRYIVVAQSWVLLRVGNQGPRHSLRASLTNPWPLGVKAHLNGGIVPSELLGMYSSIKTYSQQPLSPLTLSPKRYPINLAICSIKALFKNPLFDIHISLNYCVQKCSRVMTIIYKHILNLYRVENIANFIFF